jgi:DNA polymerase I-like protein with 3'-5' exonuclease and polymerase domains
VARVNYYVDLETTVNGGPQGDSPEGHWANNEIILCGYARTNGGVIHITTTAAGLESALQEDIDSGHEPNIIAHNAKFDLKYLIRDCPFVDWSKVHVHDTMTWEYRNSGHTTKFMSLEDAAASHNILFKKSMDLGDLLSKGIKMEDIPIEDLKSYLIADVDVLKSLYKLQSNIATWWMDYILPLAEMELNGMAVNIKKSQAMMKDLTTKTEGIETRFINAISDRCEWQDGTPLQGEDFNPALGIKSKYVKPMAARTLSFLLTGAPAHLDITSKWKLHFKPTHGPVYSPLPSVFDPLVPTHLGYPMGEGVLKVLTDWMSQDMLAYRGYDKLLGTYVGPFLTAAQVQGTIHPKLNTCVTGTGRLSSSSPNGQNIPKEARKLIRSKYLNNGMTEWDFSQLEIVAVACVSGCPALLADIKAGVDVHYKSGKAVYGWQTEADMCDDERKVVKGVNFGLLYGGKAGGLAIQTGIAKKKVQDLIDSFYSAYPGVAIWQKKVFTEVCNNMEPYKIDQGEQRYKSVYDEPFSGRRFTFLEQASPKWMRQRTHRKWSFSPQQVANYPIQGFAGGDIVMYALYILWKEARKTVRFVMTVHDSIIAETPVGYDPKPAMARACQATTVKYNLPVVLQFDVDTGPTWS